MLRNYFIIAVRNLVKYKWYSLINILGLSAGMICAIFLMLWIKSELSYDQFHKNIDNIATAWLKVNDKNSGDGEQPNTSHALPRKLLAEYPEFENFVRIGFPGELVFKTDDKLVVENNGIAADKSIFEIFSFDIVAGTVDTSFSADQSIYISRKYAEKYFGKDNPLEKQITINNSRRMTVKGIFSNIPENSHLRFDYILPFQVLKLAGHKIDYMDNAFYNCRYRNYFLLKPGVSIPALNEKLYKEVYFENAGMRGYISLLPLSVAYRYSGFAGEWAVWIFGSLALLIMVIASINYMNLASARASVRAKEVGIRKVSGAFRNQLIFQFLGESLLTSFISLIIALLMCELLMPQFNILIEKTVSLDLSDPLLLLSLVSLTLITGLSAGIYPARAASSIQPVKILREAISFGSNRGRARKILVTLQFTFSSLFIVCSAIISYQFYYMDHKEKGYQTEDLIYVNLKKDIRADYKHVREKLLENSDIKQVTFSSHLPSGISGGYYQAWGIEGDEEKYIIHSPVDYNYFRILNLRMIKGRNFQENFGSDLNNSVILNETAARLSGISEPVGKQILFHGKYSTIIGIVEDFHHAPLDSKIKSIIFTPLVDEPNYMILQTGTNTKNATSWLNKTLEEFSPEFPLTYHFMQDSKPANQKTAETARIMMFIFTFLSIFISCMGLLGLSSFMIVRKMKEIGIRKAMGANMFTILSNISGEYIRIIIASVLISWPAAYLLMDSYLENFAYRIELSPWIFIISGLLILGLVMITVSFHSIKAAKISPGNILRQS